MVPTEGAPPTPALRVILQSQISHWVDQKAPGRDVDKQFTLQPDNPNHPADIQHRSGRGLGDYGAVAYNLDVLPPPGTKVMLGGGRGLGDYDAVAYNLDVLPPPGTKVMLGVCRLAD